jgi:hypothetical protein
METTKEEEKTSVTLQLNLLLAIKPFPCWIFFCVKSILFADSPFAWYHFSCLETESLWFEPSTDDRRGFLMLTRMHTKGKQVRSYQSKVSRLCPSWTDSVLTSSSTVNIGTLAWRPG